VRVVLDPNVLVSSLISSAGPSRQIVDAWVQGRFELVASPVLLGELSDVVSRPRFRRWVSLSVAGDFIAGLEDAALILDDPPSQPGLTADPDDDYLVALARDANADFLVSGDRHLTGLVDAVPSVLTPRQFRDRLLFAKGV
jgi:putative PIN family toxin of toxin-antitoxin system